MENEQAVKDDDHPGIVDVRLGLLLLPNSKCHPSSQSASPERPSAQHHPRPS
jgi:hypothetical protein